MIFSSWQPEGGYAYYESSVRHPIGDDIPEVKYPAGTRLGVPAQDVGYPVPADAKYVGSGSEPQGIMAPMARGGHASLGDLKTKLSHDETVVLLFVLGVLGVAAWSSRKG